MVSGVAATSVAGRPLSYAVVGDPDNVTEQTLRTISRQAQELRDPTLSAARVNELVASTPAILWVAANVHGNEKSGADAALKLLYELAGANVVSDEVFGDGRVVSFSIDPNLRAWTLGTDHMLWNALTGPDPRSTGARQSPRERAAAVDRAQRGERRTEDVGDAIRVAVPSSEAATARSTIRAIGLRPITTRLGDDRRLLIVPNVEHFGLEESRELALVLPRLERAGVTVLWASLPGP